MNSITELLGSIRPTTTSFAGRLSITPLIQDLDLVTTPVRNYRTLGEALAIGKVQITEVSDAGSVPNLALNNLLDDPVLLIDGDTLVGAKQNRTLNVSILVPAATQMTIPVSCVEAGRWSKRTALFSASRDHMFASGRARMMGDVHRSMDRGLEPRAEQHKVWSDIDRKMRSMRVDSDTRAMDDLFAAREPELESTATSAPVLEKQVGAVFALNGKVVGIDCFDHPDTFRELYPKILRSYALEALDAANDWSEGTIASAEEFLLVVSQAIASTDASPGLGRHVRLRSSEVIGSALEFENRVIHLSAFWKQSDGAHSDDRSGM